MERNTILAIVLSVFVLLTYQAIFGPPKQHPVAKNSQNIAAQYLSSNKALSPASATDGGQQTTNASNKTADYKFGTTESNISYSDVGGSLHNVDFIGNKPFPLTDILEINGLGDVKYSGEKLGDNAVSLTYSNKDWQVTKTYEIKDKNLISVRMEIKNVSAMSILNNLSFKAFEIDESSIDTAQTQNSRENALFEYSVNANNKIFRKGSATKFNDKSYKQQEGRVSWVGFRDHYHALIVKPEFETKGYEIKADGEKELNVSILPQERNLAAGESVIYDFSVYAGPQNPGLMKKYGKGFEKIFAFSNFGIIEWVAQAIYHIIPFFHTIFKSWGVAIILISVLIYGITYPLTMQSMMSMRKMQEAQPKINALKERYKDDPQKMNAEMMEIYRREKINPFGGCLPFIIQMPFFMALYQILWRAQYFQGQGFLWIKDLSQPDRLFILPFQLPFLGNELNILPILTGGIMFVQQKISSRNMVITDEQQAMQQKMMTFVLPVMMTFMFYKFASSWAIYFCIFYILSTLAQWRIAKLSAAKNK